VENSENNERQPHTNHWVDQKWASPQFLHQWHCRDGGQEIDQTGQANNPFNQTRLYTSVPIHKA
jgi:hypothetical protein